jgi:hypothetical protein
VETLINIVIVAFGLLLIAGALFGRGERGTISSRVRRVMAFTAGLLVTGASNQSVTQGQSTSYTLTLSPEGGYTGSVQFTCSGAPSESTCSGPSPIKLDGVHPSQVSFNVTTTAPSDATLLLRHLEIGDKTPLSALSIGAIALFMVGTLVIRVRNNSRQSPWIARIAIVLPVVFCLSCGGSSGPPPPPHDPGTPVGTYNLTLTASDSNGTPSHATTVTLKVEKK